MILAGGFDPGYRAVFSVYEGVLDENKDDVKWNTLPNMERPRRYHTAFYLKNKLYIVGGMGTSWKYQGSCEVYDVSKEMWFEGPSLPFAVGYPTAITDINGTYALIVGKIKFGTSIMIFNADNGFQEAISTNVDLGYQLVVASLYY